MTNEPPPGYEAVVHHSLLETLRLGGVPFQFVIANLILTMVVVVTFQLWRYLVVGVVVHGLLYLVTYKEPQRMTIIGRYLSYRAYYGVR
jgi:type IV secretory pathway TrbD component